MTTTLHVKVGGNTMKITGTKDFVGEDRDDLGVARLAFDRFLAGRPVELEVVPTHESPRTDVREGAVFMRIKNFRVGFMLTHELGHLLLTPDRDLHLPNLGMTLTDDFCAVPTDQAQRNEIEIAALQEVMFAGLGKPTTKERQARVRSLLRGALGDYVPGGLRNFESFFAERQAAWPFERISAGLDRKLDLATATAAVRVAA